MPTILFPYQVSRSFIDADLAVLRSAYRVEVVPCLSAAEVLRAARAVERADLLCCWFGSLKFLPAVMRAAHRRIPVLVICGGYDVASEPAIGYGTMRRPVTRWLGRRLFSLADAVAPFSASASAEARLNANVAAERIRVIPLGFDPPRDADLPAREPVVLTVAHIDNSTLERKGLLTIARVARALPHIRFTLAGEGTRAVMARLRAEAGPNLNLPGRVSDLALQQLFARATVYLQPSVHEGFGSAVAEAMLHGCIPVVSNVHSLPEVVGPCGVYANPGDVAAFADLVQGILWGRIRPTVSPRDFVLQHFPAERRRTALLDLVATLLVRNSRTDPPPACHEHQ
jgi:glycosyltransferase involved in cell wall biosynthesis